MDLNQSNIKLDFTSYLTESSNSLSLEELQLLLSKKGICKELYTHPVVVSLLGKLLIKCNGLSTVQIAKLLDDIISVSRVNNSFTLVFSKPYNEKLFSYQLENQVLIFTKQVFVKDTCTTITRYFDLCGKKISESEFDVYKLDEPTSYTSNNYQCKKEDDYLLK